MQHQPGKKLHPTLGELIAAAGQVAFECSNSDREGYQLARLALIEILKGGLDPKELDFAAVSRYLH